jgi:small-conductance mechanosensitive channel
MNTSNVLTHLDKTLKFIVPLGIILSGFLIGYFLENRLKKVWGSHNKESRLYSYQLFLQCFHGIILVWCLLVAIALALPTINLPETLLVLIEKTLIASFLVSATFLASRLAVKLIRIYSQKNESTLPLTSLFEYLTKVIIFIIGFLIIVQSLGVQITALITAFGVGSLSIGLAFQNTLSNLISGVNIIVSRKIRPGDYIKLKDGEEGYVVDVELKYTLIKDITNNIMVIPNSQLINASFKNYTLIDQEMLLAIPLVVSYESDLEQVERITLNIAKNTQNNVAGAVSNYEPFMRYEKFDYFSINFTVYLKVHEYYDQLIVRHEFIKNLYQEYQKQGIKMPFPLQNSYYNNFHVGEVEN